MCKEINMKKIGIVSCEKWKNLIQEDKLLEQTLNKAGFNSQIISWEDKTIDYNEFDCLVLRSVWGYQNNYSEFKRWLLWLKKNNVKIFNAVDIILNNIRKNMQFEILDKHGIPHVPTKFIMSVEKFKNLDENVVVKPIISGSGENTFKVGGENVNLNTKIEKNDIKGIFSNMLECEDNGIMVQPFIPDIKNGEYACVFIGGVNTHNMLRFPGVFTDKKAPVYLETVPIEVELLAKKISKIEEFANSLYMRIDIVYYDNKPIVMEIELAEPDLLIKYVKNENLKSKILKRFVEEIERRL